MQIKLIFICKVLHINLVLKVIVFGTRNWPIGFPKAWFPFDPVDRPWFSLRTADVSPRSLPLRDVSRGGTSATQREKFHTDDAKSVRNPVRSANLLTKQFHCFSYCLQITDKRQKAAKVKCKRDESLTKQPILICGIQSSLEEAFEFCWSSFEDEHNTLPKSTRRNVELNKFAFGTPWLPNLLCKHWFTSSVWNFCRRAADVPPCEMSLSGDERGETPAVCGLVLITLVV